MNSLLPADDAFDPLASVETGAGESGGTADVGGVSAEDEGGGEDDIESGDDTDLFNFTLTPPLASWGWVADDNNKGKRSRIRFSIFVHLVS